MLVWDRDSLSAALGIEVTENVWARRIEFNSLNIIPDDLFLAMKSTRDGHDFILDALNKGAGVVIAEYIPANIPEHFLKKILIVESVEEALSDLADYNLARINPKIIAVTGSVGKTSTKEFLGLALSSVAKTFISRANFNNYLGLRINLASMPIDTEIAVIELGMSAKGEILRMSKLIKPDISIITVIAPAHLESFNSIEEIALAKSEIFHGMESGVAIINADDKYYDIISSEASIYAKKIFTFGKIANSDSKIVDYNSSIVSYDVFGNIYNLEFTNVISAHQAFNIAAVILAVKLVLNNEDDFLKAVAELENLEMTPGRGNVVTVKLGEQKEFRVINDSYNANPASMRAALDSLSCFLAKRKIVIFSDMKELGRESIFYHINLGFAVAQSNIDLLITVGTLSNYISQQVEGSLHFDTIDEAKECLLNLVQDGDLILVKGSNSTKISDLVSFLLKMREVDL